MSSQFFPYIVASPLPLDTTRASAVQFQIANTNRPEVPIETITITMPGNVDVSKVVLSPMTGWNLVWETIDGKHCLVATPTVAPHTVKEGDQVLLTLYGVQPSGAGKATFECVVRDSEGRDFSCHNWLAIGSNVAQDTTNYRIFATPSTVTLQDGQASVNVGWTVPATWGSYDITYPQGGETRTAYSSTEGDPPDRVGTRTVTITDSGVTVFTLQCNDNDKNNLQTQVTVTADAVPTIKSFSAAITSATDEPKVRFSFETENVTELRIEQALPKGGTKQIWDNSGGQTSPVDITFDVGESPGEQATFRLIAAPNSQGHDATCTFPRPQILAYWGYIDRNYICLVTAIQAAKQAVMQIPGSPDIVIGGDNGPNGVCVTTIEKSKLFADPPTLTWRYPPGQAIADLPQIVLDGSSHPFPFVEDSLQQYQNDLQAVDKLVNQNGDFDETWSEDYVRNNVIWWLTNGIVGTSADVTAEVKSLSALDSAALVEQALLRGFVWLAKLATPAEFLSNTIDCTKKILDYCTKSGRVGVLYDRLDTRSLVGAAIAIYEQTDLIRGDYERAGFYASRSLWLPNLRRPSLSQPVDRFFWIQLKARDPEGEPLVLVPNADGTGVELAVRSSIGVSLDNQQLWRIEHSADNDNHGEQVKLWSCGRSAYMNADWGFQGGTGPLVPNFDPLMLEGSELYFPISAYNGHFNANGDGPYNPGTRVGPYDWQGGHDNELWQLVEPSAVETPLATGQGLGVGACLSSPGGTTQMVLQMDGNLVIYKQGSPVWGSDSYLTQTGPRRIYLMMEATGLNLYDENNNRLWSSSNGDSGYKGNLGRFAVLGDDGILQITDSDGRKLWSPS